ncbi:hypothetical protein WAB17_13615 [Parerythrobacter aurantius]|uniref:hypothetical protein n=1 Tax=Parerythrobacter aurantius TaxID=3127706 RepID=UPI0032494F17
MAVVVLFIVAISIADGIKRLSSKTYISDLSHPPKGQVLTDKDTSSRVLGEQQGASLATAVEGETEPAAPTVSRTIDGQSRLAERADNSSFIPLNFSLPQTSGSSAALAAATDGSIRVRKVVQSGTREIGAVDIVIDRTSLLLMDIADARKLVDGNDQKAAKLAGFPPSGLVTFKALREKGIDLRYDPNRDIIVLGGG